MDLPYGPPCIPRRMENAICPNRVHRVLYKRQLKHVLDSDVFGLDPFELEVTSG